MTENCNWSHLPFKAAGMVSWVDKEVLEISIRCKGARHDWSGTPSVRTMGALHPIINPRESETKKTIAAPWVCWLLTFPIAGPICCCEWPRTGVSAGHSKPCPTGARYIEALIYGMPRCDAPLLAVGDSASGRTLQLWLRPQPALLPWTCRRLVVVHVVILTGRSPLGDRGRQSMRCAPHLASSTPSVPRRARDGTGGREWLAGLPQDVSTGGCVVRVQSHLPHHGQRQHAPSRFPTPVGDIRKDAQNSPFLLAKRYRRVQLSSATTYIILR